MKQHFLRSYFAARCEWLRRAPRDLVLVAAIAATWGGWLAHTYGRELERLRWEKSAGCLRHLDAPKWTSVDQSLRGGTFVSTSVSSTNSTALPIKSRTSSIARIHSSVERELSRTR